MEFKVKSLYLKISPRKMRPVLHGLRSMTALEARNTLAFTNKKAAGFLHSLVNSGIAVAKENYFEADQVRVKSITCDEGPRLKRIEPWSKGQARRITKRMCHVTLVLETEGEKVSAKVADKEIKESKEEE
jgi:large subunit ribosomal protein L22